MAHRTLRAPRRRLNQCYWKRQVPRGPASVPAGTSPKPVLRGFEVEIGPYRHMVRRLFPAAHIAIDPDIDQPIAGLRRQQQMIDAQTLVFLPGASLVIPERVLP